MSRPERSLASLGAVGVAQPPGSADGDHPAAPRVLQAGQGAEPPQQLVLAVDHHVLVVAAFDLEHVAGWRRYRGLMISYQRYTGPDLWRQKKIKSLAALLTESNAQLPAA